MESVSNKRVPVLRFKDDHGEEYREWKKKRIREFCEVNPPNDKLPESFIYIDLESVNSGILVERNKICKATAPSRAQRLLRKHDVLIQTVRPYQQNNLYFELDGDYVASTGYAQLRSGESNKFLYFSLHVKSTVNKILASCTGTSYPAINSNDLGNISICLPQLQEQQKIADFLSSIDTRIEQLEKKKALFERYKKGLMQKLFSQEIRFRDERGEEYPEWETKALGEVGEVIGGGTPDTTDQIMWNGSIVWYTPEEISKKYSNNSIRKISNQGLKSSSAKLLPIGTVLFTSRATIGKTTIALTECTTNQGFQSIVVDIEQLSNEFLYYWLTKNVKDIIRRANGSTYLEVTGKEIKKIMLAVPILKEQQKIADFLSSIDRKIELINEQVNKTREFKKGLLQLMFV